MIGLHKFYASIALAGTLLSGMLTGCAPVNLRGNGFGDQTATWGKDLRAPTQPGNLAGFDNRAREVEQNLGVR